MVFVRNHFFCSLFPQEHRECVASGKIAFSETTLLRLSDDHPPLSHTLITNHSIVRILLEVNFHSLAVKFLSVGIERISEFTAGARGNLHTIGPPLLWINLQWCKAIKPMCYGYLFILITRGSGTHCIVANKCITRRGLTSQTYLLPSLFYSALHVWVQRHSGSLLKHPLDGYPIRLGPFAPSRILFGPPLAIIDEMKVTDGEYEETVRMDGPPVRPRQRPPSGEAINMHLHVNLLKRTFWGWVGVGRIGV